MKNVTLLALSLTGVMAISGCTRIEYCEEISAPYVKAQNTYNKFEVDAEECVMRPEPVVLEDSDEETPAPRDSTPTAPRSFPELGQPATLDSSVY